MRRESKFKLVSKFYIYPYFFHNRIFRFNRPKWLIAKKKMLTLNNQIQNLKKKNFKFDKIKLLKKNILKNFFFNFVSVKSKVGSWQRLRFFFKENLLMKNAVKKYFNGQFSLSFFKKLSQKHRTRTFTISSIFIRPEFRLDILLWRLKIFSSVFFAKRAIRNNQISVNGLTKNFSFYLVKGDVIKFSPIKIYSLKKHFLKYFKVIFIPSFVEFDLYTNTIVILKSFNQFNDVSLSSVIKEPLVLDKFKNYLNK